jgi:hypothetical protein
MSLIGCARTGGVEPGTLLTVDLAHPAAAPTVVADDGSEASLEVPTAVISIAAGHTGYVALTPHGDARIYEWSVELRLVVAQRVQTAVVGSTTDPLRSWLGKTPQQTYDYDLRTEKWTTTPLS